MKRRGVARRAAAASVLVAALAAGHGRAVDASPNIDVRISFKVIHNPANGARPATAAGVAITNADLQALIDISNDALLATYWRGYRFVLEPTVEDVGTPCGACGITNPSFWYATGFGDSMDVFENQAKANPAYQWRTNAINVYVNWGQGNGGVASFPSPPDAEEIVVLGSRCFNDAGFDPRFAANILTHELGHFFDLGHTNGVACHVACTYDPDDCPSLVPSDGDGISDTIYDHQCYSRNALAQFNFGMPYNSLPPARKDSVDFVYDNLMAYVHYDTQEFGDFMPRMTEGQLDRWTDTANLTRSAVRSGRTRFVATNGSASGPGQSNTPYRMPSQAVNAASLGEGGIVLLRAGVYAENPTFSTPVTLRATRAGPARIGTPGPLATP